MYSIQHLGAAAEPQASHLLLVYTTNTATINYIAQTGLTTLSSENLTVLNTKLHMYVCLW